MKAQKERIDKGMYWDKSLYLVQGCTKVSSGCDNCWSEREYNRFSKNPLVIKHYPKGCDWKGKVKPIPENLELPLQVKQPTIFSIWNDLFHDEIITLNKFEKDMLQSGKHLMRKGNRTIPFLYEVFLTFLRCPQHTFIVLTKRPENMRNFINELISEQVLPDAESILKNVILGVSVEDQPTADERIPVLLKTPAHRRVVSVEPALSEISLTGLFDKETQTHHSSLEKGLILKNKLDWVITGGESGKDARPTHPDVFHKLQEQCEEAGVPFFFKGWGEWAMTDNGHFFKVGKKNSGRELDGKTYSQFPD